MIRQIISIAIDPSLGYIMRLEEGQCHTHKNNCDDTRKFHHEICQQWIEVLEEALEALRSDLTST